MKPYSSFLSTLAALLLPSLGAFAQKALPTIQLLQTFDLPGLASETAGINQRGDIVGHAYKDLSQTFHIFGFGRSANGAVSTFYFPGAEKTYPTGINSSGTIGGYYSDGPRLHGFFRTRDGVFSTLDLSQFGSTSVYGINDAGDFVGNYTDASQYNPFLESGGVLIPIDLGFFTEFTVAYAISSNGMVTGIYATSFGDKVTGFIRGADGTILSGIRDHSSTFAYDTFCSGINARGFVVGVQSSEFTPAVGFLFRAPDQFINYSVPDSLATIFTGINDHGRICGYYLSSDNKLHGMVLQVVE